MGTLTLRTETLWIPGTLTTRILIRPKELKHFTSRSGAAELKHYTTARRGVAELKHYTTTGSRGLSLRGSWKGAAELKHFTSARKGASWNSSIARQVDPGGSHYADPTCISRNSSIARKELVRGDSHTSHADPEFKKTKGTVETRGNQKIT